ncbi:MAG: hypothetical protein U0234_25770 [Sandaracinus sp.]
MSRTPLAPVRSTSSARAERRDPAGEPRLYVVGRAIDRAQVIGLLSALRVSRFDLADVSLYMRLDREPVAGAAESPSEHARGTLRSFGPLGRRARVSRSGNVLSAGPLSRTSGSDLSSAPGLGAIGLPADSLRGFEQAVALGSPVICLETPHRGWQSQARRIFAACGIHDIAVAAA